MTDRVTEASGPGYRVERVEGADGSAALRFAGELRFRQCFEAWNEVRDLARPAARRMRFDVSQVEGLDGGATALLLELRAEAAAAGSDGRDRRRQPAACRACSSSTARIPTRPSLQAPPAKIGILDQIGRETLDARATRATPSTSSATSPSPARRRSARRGGSTGRDVPRLMERAGADGMPIVLHDQLPGRPGDGLPGGDPAEAVRRQHLRRRPRRPLGDARARRR